MPFELHPWTWTHAAPFLGYQGEDPRNNQVQCVFLGKDANFPTDEELNASPDSANLLRQYLTTPQEFFQEHLGVHHPFRHSAWAIPEHDGGRFHQRFATLLNLAGQQNRHFQLQTVSILELLCLPTIGNSGACSMFRNSVAGLNLPQDQRERQHQHLGIVESVLNCTGKRVFVFAGFGGLWRRFTGPQRDEIQQHAPALFALGNLLQMPHALGQALPFAIQAQVYLHTHFSAAIANAELRGIANIVSG